MESGLRERQLNRIKHTHTLVEQWRKCHTKAISVCVTRAKNCFTRDQWHPVLLNVCGPPVLGEEARPSPVPSGSPRAGEDQETLI